MKNFTDITQAQQVERWENVLRVLRGLSRHERKKHWNMEVFIQETMCGTAACAAGYCSMDPWFKRRGFALDRMSVHLDAGPLLKDGIYIGRGALHFFGEDGARQIFFRSCRRSVGQVIKEVRAHIKTLQAPRVVS